MSAADPASATTGSAIDHAIVWERFLADEERRVRGGAPLTGTWLERAITLGLGAGPVGAALRPAHGTNGRALDASLQEADPKARRAALMRALAVAAAIEDRALSDAAAALVLCAEGRTDVIRFLPFGEARGNERDRATEAWRAGEPARWQSLGLEAAAGAARRRRASVEWLLREAATREEQSLEPMGRAAITARRALHYLRDAFATTVGALGDALGVSLPAAGDALRRLDESGLVSELTGRRRGRVYAYTAALTIADEASS